MTETSENNENNENNSPESEGTPDPYRDPSVDTGPLERAQEAIDEGHEAAARALGDQARGEADMDFQNVETNTDSEASDNAVPRPN